MKTQLRRQLADFFFTHTDKGEIEKKQEFVFTNN